jgi:hypothetical protein
MVVKSGNVVTAGAALGHMDLALWLIRGVSPELASLTAKYLIVDSRPSQTAYALTDHLIHSDSVVHRFERWARARLARGFSLDSAARAVGASKRTVPPTIAPTGCAVRCIGRGPDGRLWLVVEEEGIRMSSIQKESRRCPALRSESSSYLLHSEIEPPRLFPITALARSSSSGFVKRLDGINLRGAPKRNRR